MRMNPFAPGVGTPPPELVGCDEILSNAESSYLRAKKGYSSRPMMLLGLRGVGKTVLLTEIGQRARSKGIAVAKVEAPENGALADLLYPEMRRVLRSLSTAEKAKDIAVRGLRALKSFATGLKISISDIEVSIEPEVGLADTGNIESDLPDMFEMIGRAAAEVNTAWLLLLDEVQYLNERDLSALIVSMHRMAQEGLPVVFIGAGLPQVARLAGEAKSYAERMFLYPEIGPLTDSAVREAVVKPLLQEKIAISDEAVQAIVEKTHGYPFFVQALAYQVCEMAQSDQITLNDVAKAYPMTLRELDQSFFRVRFDRLSNTEIMFVQAMANLGDGPYLIKDIAEVMQRKASSLSPVRSSLIRKGMIYSQRIGQINFTVPLFASFVKRRCED